MTPQTTLFVCTGGTFYTCKMNCTLKSVLWCTKYSTIVAFYRSEDGREQTTGQSAVNRQAVTRKRPQRRRQAKIRPKVAAGSRESCQTPFQLFELALSFRSYSRRSKNVLMLMYRYFGRYGRYCLVKYSYLCDMWMFVWLVSSAGGGTVIGGNTEVQRQFPKNLDNSNIIYV